MPVNQRYSYQPAAVAFVNSVKQVSQVAKIGYDLGYHIVTRSGGVRPFVDLLLLPCLMLTVFLIRAVQRAAEERLAHEDHLRL